MKRISIDVMGLAAVSLGTGCARDFEPSQPWYLPAGNDDDADQDGSSAAQESGEPPASATAADGGDTVPTDASADDHGGGETMVSDGAGSSEVGDGPPQSPYEGGWDIGDCQNQIAAATNDPGGSIGDITFTDQFGEQVRLYDFCHKAVLMVEGAFW